MTETVNVTLSGYVECDLCSEHPTWQCQNCGVHWDHYQDPDGFTVECMCGVLMQVTAEEHERWHVEWFR